MRKRNLCISIVLLLSIVFLGAGLETLGLNTNLSGTWVMLQVYPRIAILPIVGESTQTSYVVQFVSIEQDGTSLVMQDRYCFTVIEESSPLAATEIPDSFMRSLSPSLRFAALSEQDGRMTFEQVNYLEIRGAVLANPEIDELPTDPEDSRVIDQDGDGFPGMTVHVNIFGLFQAQVYVVQRVQYELSGEVISGDRVEGLIRWNDEQVVLAATSPLLLAESESRQDPDPTKHRFLMLRANDDWTCEWLREQWRVVFELEPADEG